MATEFDTVLRQFKAGLLEYKVTGQTVYKRQADVAEKWIRDYLATLNKTIESDATYIDKFAKEYEKTNPELVKFKNEIADARKEGPKLQDIYKAETIAAEEVPVDESGYYTKAAAVGGILALGAIVSFL